MRLSLLVRVGLWRRVLLRQSGARVRLSHMHTVASALGLAAPCLSGQKAMLGGAGQFRVQHPRRPTRSSRKGASRHRAMAFFGGGSNKPQDAPQPEPVVSAKLALLLTYVQEVQPSIVEDFQDRAPPQVLDAMTQTVSNMIGTLPPQFFDVKISAHGENLAQLLFSVMMTGYLFRNAQYRLELTHSLALPAGQGDASGTSYLPAADSRDYAPGTQKSRVRGEVIRWSNANGPEAIPAASYIESLEEELTALRRQLAQHRALVKQTADPQASGRNALLEYLKGLDAAALEELTACADDDSAEAMNTLIHRVLGTNTTQELRRVTSESSAEELSHLLFYLMVVGYLLRTLEVRFYLDSSTSMDDLGGGGGSSSSDSESGSGGGGSSGGGGIGGGGFGSGLLWGL